MRALFSYYFQEGGGGGHETVRVSCWGKGAERRLCIALPALVRPPEPQLFRHHPPSFFFLGPVVPLLGCQGDKWPRSQFVELLIISWLFLPFQKVFFFPEIGEGEGGKVQR